MEKFKVKFYPDKKTVEVPKDTTILSAALTGGIYINSACGGDGVCGKCKVVVRKGEVAAQPNNVLTLKERKRHIYLACQAAVHSNLEVEVPSASKLDFEKSAGLYGRSEDVELVTPSSARDAFEYSPLTKKIYLELPRPDLHDRLSDLDRLYRQINRSCPKK